MKKLTCYYDNRPAQWWVVLDDGYGYPMCTECKDRAISVYADRLSQKELSNVDEMQRKFSLQFRSRPEAAAEKAA
jgi:hypothetical protein